MNEEPLGRMEFTYQFSEQNPKVSISLSAETCLPEILEAFESFLLASGYCFKGQLDFVEEPNVNEENNEPS